MKLKNYQLDVLAKVLNYPMTFKKSRVKNKFLTEVYQNIELMEKDRKVIIDKLCKKDNDKKPILKDNRFTFTDSNLEKFNKEYAILSKEEVELPNLSTEIITMIENSSVEMDDIKGDTLILEEILKPKSKEEKAV